MRRRGRGWRTVAGLVALGAALLAGCGEQKPEAAKPKHRIALILRATGSEFSAAMAESARKHQQKNETEYELLVDGVKNEADAAGQIALVEKMIADRVDAIVLAPADPKQLVAVCQKAQQRGIQVVNIETQLDVEAVKEAGISIPFVGPDDREGARLAGEFLARKLAKGDEVAILGGRRTSPDDAMLKLGFGEAMEKAGINVASSQSANDEQGDAEKVVARILAAKPDIKAYLCTSDRMALGALAALKDKPDALIVGCGNAPAIRQPIQDGRVLCTVDLHPDRVAAEGLHVALELIARREVRGYTKTPADVVAKGNLK